MRQGVGQTHRAIPPGPEQGGAAHPGVDRFPRCTLNMLASSIGGTSWQICTAVHTGERRGHMDAFDGAAAGPGIGGDGPLAHTVSRHEHEHVPAVGEGGWLFGGCCPTPYDWGYYRTGAPVLVASIPPEPDPEPDPLPEPEPFPDPLPKPPTPRGPPTPEPPDRFDPAATLRPVTAGTPESAT